MSFRILVVDDEEYIVHLLRRGLVNAGFEVLEAYDGEQALTVAREHKPDLILLDVNMPKKNGYQVCRELKADPNTHDAIVFFVTARGEEIDEKEAYEVGAIKYVTKPFSLRRLVEEIRKALAQHGKESNGEARAGGRISR